MRLDENSNLVLAFARVLYVNGQSTDQTVDATERVGDALGLRAKLMPRWGALQLQAEDGDARGIFAVAAGPGIVRSPVVVDKLRQQISVAATVGRIMTFDTPQVEAGPLEEMLA